MNAALMCSKASDESATPQPFFDALDAEFAFTVDVAATGEHTKCRHWFGPARAGMTRSPWTGRPTAWPS
jgi:DNA N-6-adenine-methyltransferase (Dam)